MAVTISIARYDTLQRARRAAGFIMIENSGAKGQKPIRGKRLFVATIVLVAATIIGHTAWSLLSGRGVNQRIARIRAAGEPILPADFATTNPAGADNGGPDIDAA